MKYGKTLLFVLSVLLWLASARGYAATYYVDVNNSAASDSNPGTSGSPLKTIRKAVSLAKAGDSILVRNGIYREPEIRITADGTSSLPIKVSAAGDSVIIRGTSIIKNSDFVKLSGYTWVYSRSMPEFKPDRVVETSFSNWKPIPVEDPNGVKFVLTRPVAYQPMSGISAVDSRPGSFFYDSLKKVLYVRTFDGKNPSLGAHLIEAGRETDGSFRIEGDHIVLQGFGMQFSKGIFLYNLTGGRVKNCDLLAAPLVIQTCNNTQASGIRIENVINRGPEGKWDYAGSGRGLVILGGTKNRVINVTIKKGWNAALLKGTGTTPSDNWIDGAIIWGFPNHALEVKEQVGATLNRVRIWNAQDSLYVTASSNINVYNSTVYEGVHVRDKTSNFRIRNTIVFTGLAVLADSTTGFNSDYNVYVRGDDIYKYSGQTLNTVSAVKTQLGQEAHSLQVTSTADLFDKFLGRTAEGNKFALKSGSPAIDRGDPSFPVPPNGGSRIDIGAMEYGTTATAPKAPTNLRIQNE